MEHSLRENQSKIYNVIVILLIILGLSQLYNITIINVAISVILAGILCVCPAQIDVVIIFLLVPFFNLFSVRIGTTSFYYIYVLIYIFKYFNFNHWKLGKRKVLIVFCAILLTIFWMDIAVQLKWLVLFSLLVINYKNELFLNNLPSIVKQISISTLISSVVGYVMLLQGKSIYTQSYIYSASGNTTRFAGLVGDSVFCGQFNVIIIALILAMVLKNRISKTYGYLLSAAISFFVIITFSRTAIILLALVVFLYLITYIQINIHNKKTIHRAIIILFILCISIVGGISYVSMHMDNPLISKYVIRFSSLDLWTGRASVTENYIERVSSSISHIFIGMTYDEYTLNGIRVGETIITRAHNIYLETICLFGLIPALAIFAFCAIKIFNYIKEKKGFFYGVPFFVLLASGISLHGHIEWPYYFLVALCFGLMDYSCLKRKEE